MWGPHAGISAPVRRDSRELLPLSIMYAHGEKVPSASQKVSPAQGNESAGTLGLGYPAPRTVRNEFLLFQLPGCGIMAVQAN